MAIRFRLNEREVLLDVDPETPLLWAIRDHLGLTGTKYSCGVGICGACTLLVDGRALHSCTVPVGEMAGREVTTIEGAGVLPERHVLDAWVAEDVSQCGYCQPGIVMSAISLLRVDPDPTPEAIRESITNLCRCGTYARVERAIRRAGRSLRDDASRAAPTEPFDE